MGAFDAIVKLLPYDVKIVSFKSKAMYNKFNMIGSFLDIYVALVEASCIKLFFWSM